MGELSVDFKLLAAKVKVRLGGWEDAFTVVSLMRNQKDKWSSKLMNVAATVNTHKQESKLTTYLCSNVELWDSLRALKVNAK